MVHNDQAEYKDIVLNLLAEVITQLEKENLKFKEDYWFTNNKEGEPVILIKEVYAEKFKSMYTDFAWSQLTPYILFLNQEEI
jgi:hypothetical protein